MPKLRLRHAFVAGLVLVGMLVQGTWALAGTTGGVSGTLTDTSTGKPVGDASITAISPSQSSSTTTDAGGHFGFLNLAPDTYTVSATKSGYASVSRAGVTVFADQNATVSLATHPELRTIANVTSRAAGTLVKPGTTSDVYSVNAATQQVVSGSSGGFNLNQAYSGIYSQPGVTSYIGNYGWGQVFYIRGGSYNQTGYEFDGVPVNRAFDNYQANSLSSLGQQELQVYTGGSPAGASSATLGGFINQVIKTGTYPGFGMLQGGIGAPGFYHSLTAEAGGASPNRNFSYYVGLMGYNQHFPYGSYCNLCDINPNGLNQYGLVGPAETSNLYAALIGCGFGINAGCPDGGQYGSNFFYTNGPWPACNNATGVPSGYSDANPGTFNGACFGYYPFGNGYLGDIYERDNVVNLHFGLPHHHDTGKDDIQLLYDNSMQYQLNASSQNENGGIQQLEGLSTPFIKSTACFGPGTGCGQFTGVGGYLGTGETYNGPYPGICGERNFWAFLAGTCVNGIEPIPYADTQIFAPGTTFGQSVGTAKISNYYFPNSPQNRTLFSSINPNLRDGFWNDVNIVKAQYTHNMGSNAYARLFGYTFYSDWLISGPTAAATAYVNGTECGCYFGETPNYELATHTRGAEFQFADQINPEHLLNFTANYTQAGVTRFNNSSFRSASSGAFRGVTNLTNGDANNPECFSAATGALKSCFSSSSYGRFPAFYQTTDLNLLNSIGIGNPLTHGESADPCAAGELPANSPACLAGAKWLVTVPGGQGTYNTVLPKFTSMALTDDFKPNDKFDLNFGLRFENYEYDLRNTNNPEFNFWFNAEAQILCYDPVTKQPMFTPLGPGQLPPPALITTAPFGPCKPGPSGAEGLHPTGLAACSVAGRVDCGPIRYTAQGPSKFSHSEWSPRIGGTYTFTPDTVLRFSFGKYTQPTETAFEQYLDQSGKRAANFDFSRFFGLGFNTPAHDNQVQYSLNYDLSIEQRLHNTDWTFKVSPFYRDTRNQIVTVLLSPGFVSGVNVGHQHSYGVEVGVQKGDPTRDGWSGQLSYTYTKALIQYGNLASGTNSIDYLNNYIKAFNALTSAGGGSPCYQSGATGLPDPCSDPDAIKNPYFNQTVQPLLQRNGWYPTYPNEPPNDPSDNPGTTAIWPHQFNGWVQFKHGRWSIAPNFALQSGGSYGFPTDIFGIDPRGCAQNQSHATNASGGPILPAGSPYAQNPDFLSCGPSGFTESGFLAIPNPYTGKFDSVGQFTNPWQFNMGALLRYDISPRVTANLTLANIFNTCFGGNGGAWSAKFAPGSVVCGYGVNNGQASGNYVGPLSGQPGFGAGFYYGGSPTDPVNGGVPYATTFNYPFQPEFGALPFQAYLQVDIKL